MNKGTPDPVIAALMTRVVGCIIKTFQGGRDEKKSTYYEDRDYPCGNNDVGAMVGYSESLSPYLKLAILIGFIDIFNLDVKSFRDITLDDVDKTMLKSSVVEADIAYYGIYRFHFYHSEPYKYGSVRKKCHVHIGMHRRTWGQYFRG